MRTQFSKIVFLAGIALALAFTFGCSSSDGGGDGGSSQLSSSSDSWLRKSSSSVFGSSSSVPNSSGSEQSYNYCIIAGNTCLTGPFTASTCTGQLSNNCPNGSSSSITNSSSSVAVSSSSVQSSSSKGSSSSSGGGGSFNVNSQIYNEDGTPYTGNGIIEATTGLTYSNGGYEWDHVNAGNVTNGIVNLNLPQTIPNEYLRDFFDDEQRRSCTSYPENIKMFGGGFVLTNSNKDYIGSLSTQFDDEQIFEVFTYVYFTKAGKITCNLEYDITNIDAKVGWNKMYIRGNGNSTIEYNTNNILTKEMKWILDPPR